MVEEGVRKAQVMELHQMKSLNFCFLAKSESLVSFSVIQNFLMICIYPETHRNFLLAMFLLSIIIKMRYNRFKYSVD